MGSSLMRILVASQPVGQGPRRSGALGPGLGHDLDCAYVPVCEVSVWAVGQQWARSQLVALSYSEQGSTHRQ